VKPLYSLGKSADYGPRCRCRAPDRLILAPFACADLGGPEIDPYYHWLPCQVFRGWRGVLNRFGGSLASEAFSDYCANLSPTSTTFSQPMECTGQTHGARTLECKRRRRRQVFYFHHHCCAERDGNTPACSVHTRVYATCSYCLLARFPLQSLETPNG
jgi:hypothetical protein